MTYSSNRHNLCGKSYLISNWTEKLHFAALRRRAELELAKAGDELEDRVAERTQQLETRTDELSKA